MRVALVAEDYYPQVGGVPEHVHHLAQELNARGHEATIVTARMRGRIDDPPFVRRVGTSLVVYANGGVARVTVGWQLRKKLAAVFREQRCDLVHVHGGLSPTLGLVAPHAAWRAGLPVVATFHTWFPRSVGYRVFRRPLQAMLDRHAATIAVSSAAIAAMSRYFTADWTIIPNGVDVDAFHPDGGVPAKDPTDRPRLLFLGRLEPRTGLETILAAMPRIIERFPGVELVVAGDGPWRAKYERKAARLGPSVRFLGEVFGQRPELYRQADLYLCPTTRASFGTTLLEAMSSGTPMLVSEIPAFREVAGRIAVTATPGAPAEWAEGVIALLGDSERRRQMREAGRAAALGFGWPKVVDRILGVYERVAR
jgi:phosphatidylinositol alpha-mannosyltransferase